MVSLIYIMRGWDPAGMRYEYWNADTFDVSGISYAGVPDFNTLVNVVALRTFVPEIPAGYSAWAPVFELTSLVDVFTEAEAGFTTSTTDATLVVPTLGTPDTGTLFRYAEERNHPGYQSDFTEVIAPTLSVEDAGVRATSSIYQFEAI
jgi:hypothetical protein